MATVDEMTTNSLTEYNEELDKIVIIAILVIVLLVLLVIFVILFIYGRSNSCVTGEIKKEKFLIYTPNGNNSKENTRGAGFLYAPVSIPETESLSISTKPINCLI